MNLQQLNTFVHVAKLGSVNKAATMLRIAQPALSRQIRLLEDDLQAALFKRHGRGMRLTQVGALLLERSQTILSLVEETRSEIVAREKGMRGMVRLGMPPTVGDVLAAPLVEKFHREYPEVQIRVVPAFSGYLVDLLARGELDVAVVYNIDQSLEIDLTPLVEEALYLVASADKELRQNYPVTLAVATEQRLVLPGPAHGLRVLLEKASRKSALKLNVCMEADELRLLKQLVMQNVGYTILPLAAISEEINAGSLCAAPIVYPTLYRKLALARSLGQTWSKPTTALAKMLQDEVSQMLSVRIRDDRSSDC